MVLAVIACLGSLLGWQFTIAQTAKSAADQRMFPAFFSKMNRMGAPVMGMIVMGIVQSLLALSTISPTLSEQFSALVNLAVVTNVVPYIIALSALTVMMQAAGVSQGVYRRNVVITLIAMLYSVYAVFASGKDAVLGGMLALSIGYVIWGFIAPRFAAKQVAASGQVKAVATFVIAFLAATLLPFAAPTPASAGTLERVKEAGKLTLGYRTDARPFSFKDESGNAAGYSVALCQKIAEQVKAELGLSTLAVEWVPVTLEGRFRDVQQGKVNLLCGADTETLARRKEVAFSIPIFPGGIGALLRADSSFRLRQVLSKGQQAGPFWRASPAEILQQQTFSVIKGATSERWLASRADALQIDAKVVPVDSYEAGIRRVLDRNSNVFFGDRAILLDAAKRSPSAQDLVVLDRRFTHEPIALALERGDDDFRLVVDRTLSRLFGSNELRDLYSKWFGKPDEDALTFFRQSALSE
jgi:putrescine:ornithine antiporter